METEGNYPKIAINQIQGLNEREQYANPNPAEFDILQGLIPVYKNTLTKAPGCKLYANFNAPILSICQTNDSRGNIIVQTKDNVYTITEDELFGVTYSPSLSLTSVDSPEIMSYARIVHKVATGGAGGAAAITWGQRPLTDIVSQIKPDGTADTFVSLAANQFTLSIGVYRINGAFAIAKTIVDAGNDRMGKIRLFNVSTALPAWLGAPNADGDSMIGKDFSGNMWGQIGGHVIITGSSKIFEIQDIVSNVANMSRGQPTSLGAFEIYGWLDIWKTA